MTTLLKNQGLDVSVVGEKGLGNLRYFEGKLQVFQDGAWDTLVDNTPLVLVEDITIGYYVDGYSNYRDYFYWENAEETGLGYPRLDVANRYAPDCQLTVTVSPDNASNKTVTWASGDPEYISVTSDGVLSVSGDYTTTVTATANDGSGVVAKIQVRVIGGPV